LIKFLHHHQEYLLYDIFRHRVVAEQRPGIRHQLNAALQRLFQDAISFCN